MFEKLGLLENNYIILDTETTGFASDDEVIELGIIDINGKELYSGLFKPNKFLKPVVSRVTGISNSDLEDKPYFKDEWSKIRDIISGKTIIGHNITYDIRLINQTLDIYGLYDSKCDKLFENYVDTMDVCKHIIDLKSYKQEYIAQILNVSTRTAHRATNDCLTLLDILNVLNNANAKTINEAKNNEINVSEKIKIEKKERKLKKYNKPKCLKEKTLELVNAGMSVKEISETLNKNMEKKYSLTRLTRNNNINRDEVLEFLIKKGFVEDIRTITPLGHKFGKEYVHGDDGSKWPVYGDQILDILKKEKFSEFDTAVYSRPLNQNREKSYVAAYRLFKQLVKKHFNIHENYDKIFKGRKLDLLQQIDHAELGLTPEQFEYFYYVMYCDIENKISREEKYILLGSRSEQFIITKEKIDVAKRKYRLFREEKEKNDR